MTGIQWTRVSVSQSHTFSISTPFHINRWRFVRGFVADYYPGQRDCVIADFILDGIHIIAPASILVRQRDTLLVNHGSG